MKKTLFQGACTALVTPFLGERVNYPMLEQLLVRQIESGISSVVLCGTTGESPTLSDSEKLEIIARGKAFVGDRCQIIAGTGSNDTSHAVSLGIAAEKCGADALLVVAPYYNKATEEGLYRHYETIASAVHIPVIVYNVPSRTGVDIPISVYQKLSKIPNIAGVKEASTDISKISRIIASCGTELPVWVGNDELAVPAIAVGAKGVISVLSNVKPVQTQAMALAALDGDFDSAAALHIKMLPLMQALFCEVNPIPVKAAMDMIGFDCGQCRLPLTKLSDEHAERLEALL